MNKKIILTESEKSRILGMHRSAVISEKKPINDAIATMKANRKGELFEVMFRL